MCCLEIRSILKHRNYENKFETQRKIKFDKIDFTKFQDIQIKTPKKLEDFEF